MLKQFEVSWTDSDGRTWSDMVLAFDSASAVRSYVYTHPEKAGETFSCRELPGENARPEDA